MENKKKKTGSALFDESAKRNMKLGLEKRENAIKNNEIIKKS